MEDKWTTTVSMALMLPGFGPFGGFGPIFGCLRALWWLKPAVELLENTCPLLVANDCRSGHMKFPTVPLFM